MDDDIALPDVVVVELELEVGEITSVLVASFVTL